MLAYTVESTLSPARDGAILLCRHRATHQLHVVKQVNRSRAALDSIANEAMAYKHLRASKCRQVIQLHDIFSDSKNIYFSLEYCARGDLYAFLKAMPTQHCSPRRAKAYLAQIATGLAHVHAAGVAHRDLSLENIFVNADGDLKIGDFGLAVALPAQVTAAVGKPYYMAPEMHHGGAYDASKVDVWSLGILLWMLLTGVPLVEVATPADDVFMFLKRRGIRALISAWGLAASIPDDAIAMLELLLVLDAAERPAMTTVINHPYIQSGCSHFV
ncbi:serine/threonine protein kinase [Saprolegnia parasitica CBS 223.65]|uniref:Serine/threonine protein kinase n=1 Tax=Saprolegnia parasitica (strain CBS 223.65) TaxID=695850 RepID=A0A067CVJ1_SAPPC|nr:serine/threonine protein kinase [Saprolegnia parasitica CBS 223.65]KDO34684.1 serine/threonine protein kinase [Saprolegnia parasitica CBS 223.65]|eukprot:XP_012194356.1 serine/threonine protein kinase [Saprolegnia parasitica CBS 223.65]